MKKNILNKISLLALAFGLLTFTACSEDEEGPSGDIAADILGTWTNVSLASDGVTINGKSLVEYYTDLGVPADQIALLETLLTEGLNQSGISSFTFNDNGTYSLVDEDGTSTGTWMLTSNNSKIIFDDGEEFEFEVDVVSSSSSKIVTSYMEVDDSEDIDEDGTNDTISISVTFTFER